MNRPCKVASCPSLSLPGPIAVLASKWFVSSSLETTPSTPRIALPQGGWLTLTMNNCTFTNLTFEMEPLSLK